MLSSVDTTYKTRLLRTTLMRIAIWYLIQNVLWWLLKLQQRSNVAHSAFRLVRLGLRIRGGNAV